MAIKINLSDLMYLETTPEEILELGGIPGPRGFQGDDGPAGPTGPTGNAIVPSVDEVTGMMSFYEAPTGTIPTPVLVRGPKGETGNNLEFTWNGTQLGVRQEGDVSYTYVELKGVKGDTGLTGLTGETGGVGATGPQGNPGKNIEYIWNGTQLGIRQEGEETYTYVDLKGPKGDTGDQGNQGIQGETGNDGRGIVSVVKTSGTGSPGTLDTYTITFSDATTSTFQVYNGADGTGSGDMSKSVYDTTNNGIVDNAEKVSGFTVGKNVPADAVFTDTVYEHPASHPISLITGLQTALDGKVDDGQVLTNVPAGAVFTDTVYTHPSTHSADIIVDGTTNKAYTATEKTKLAGIATSANNYVHPTTSGNKHIPSGGSANQVLKYSADGTAVWGDAPAGVTIANNLTETVAGKALDATQGKALSDIVSTKISDVVSDTTPQLGGELDQNSHTIGGTEYDNGNSETAKTIDWKLGNHQKVTMTGNCTFTFTAPTKPCMLSLRIINDATNGRTVTLPTIRWAGGSAPAWTKLANAIDILSLYYDGSAYYGQVGLAFA